MRPAVSTTQGRPVEQESSPFGTAWYCLQWSSKGQTVQLAVVKLGQEAQIWNFQIWAQLYIAMLSTSLALCWVPPDSKMATYAGFRCGCLCWIPPDFHVVTYASA